MATASVTVMGAGVAGLSAALVLARNGHRVTLLERDSLDLGSPEEAPLWQRRGIPHFHQPHAFIPRGRVELLAHLPDVHASLLAAGAHDVDLRRKLPGPTRPGDEDMQYVAVRRPVLEWVLRRAVRDEPRINIRDGVHVTGLTVRNGRITAVGVDGYELPADVLVDALGRRTAAQEWLTQAGVISGPTESSDCGVIYYSRYYRLRPDFHLPDGPWFLSPRGDLGYFGYATFPGDNRTFAAILAIPSGVPEWRIFRHPAPFEAAVAQIPALRQWVDPEGVDPITGVMPMAGLRNSIRHWEPTAPVGLLPAGDAYCHTDPVLAHGLSFALVHAVELAAALRAHRDLLDASTAYAAATRPVLRERYDFATALDEQRHRMWLGQPVDFTRHDGDYALFSMLAAAAAAAIDPDVFRVFIRRIGLLDSIAVLDADIALQHRIEELFHRLRTAPRPPSPTRQEMLEAATAAAEP